MGSQTLELKWAHHKSNMILELQELYINDALLDVTIACGEFSLKAHKTVLSASSSFFRKLFLDNPCKHPILIMTDIAFEDLKIIMEFIYQGQIHISREKLTQFLKTADKLKIKGLSNIGDVNLTNSPEDDETDTCYSSGPWEQTNTQSKQEDSANGETIDISHREVTDYVHTETRQEAQVVKVEENLSHSADNSCMYWQNECFDQTSSSNVLHDCNPNPSVVPQELSTPSVSCQLPAPPINPSVVSQDLPMPSVSHQLPAPSVPLQLASLSSHQLPSSSVPHQITSTSVSHECEVPLSSERLAYSESQTDNEKLSKKQGENTGKDIHPVNLYQSQDQSLAIIPSGAKTEGAFEPLNNQSPSQATKTTSEACPGGKDTVNIIRSFQINEDESVGASSDIAYKKLDVCSFRSNLCQKSSVRHEILEKYKQKDSFSVMRKFPKKRHLQLLERKHTVERTPFLSEKDFVLPTNLQDHEKAHIEINNLWSNTGDKQFSCKISVPSHERMCTKRKPLWCNICQRGFTQLYNLNRHKRIHTGEKPYECPCCHKLFRDRSNLKKHERTHMG